MTKSSWVAVALVVAAAAALECKRANGAYCDDLRPCPSGFACDLPTRECHSGTVGGGDMAGVSTDMAGCTCSNPTPICVAMTCVSCLSSSDPEGACAAASPSAPHCLTTDPGSGSCVACRDASDCSGATPFCDANTHVCRGCIADTECPSLICDLTPTSANPRQCIPAGNVIYVDPNGDDGGGFGLTPSTPNKTIQHGVNNAVGLTPVRGYVHVAAGTYNESVGVNNKTIYLVGADGAIIHPTAGGKDGLGSQGATGSLTARNFTVTADMGNGGNCNMGSLAAYKVKFINSGQTGVVSVNCTPLLLDGCTVASNMAGGINVSGDFTVINSIIVKNTGGAGVYQTTGGTNTIFVNNTVADNVAGALAGGIRCATIGAQLPVNTILYNNKSGAAISETDCSGSFLATDDVSAGPQSTVDLTMQAPGFVGGGDYHLLPGSPCLDHGSTTVGPPPKHDADFLPRPDAKTMKIDLGAYELQQ